MRKIIFIILVVLASMTINAQVIQPSTALIGSWNGKLDVGGIALTLVLNLEQHDGYVGVTLDSPDQGAKGISAEKEYLSDDSIAVKVTSLDASYCARLKDGKLDGKFSQRGFSFPLVLERGDYESTIRRPQHPQPPYPYLTEEVTFRNMKDSATLAGTITYPVGYDRQTKKKPVVVLLISGSGQQNRDEEVMGHKPFLVIADYFARHGIATLRYDDRGYGASVGGEAGMSATTEDFMRDAAAGIDFLRNRKQFRKVGCLGHSEGGAIVFMLAARKKADFIISMAGPGVKGDTLLVAQSNLIEKLAGSPERLSVKQYREQESVKNMPWLKWFIDYDPSNDIRKSRCPVFALNGDRDCQVISSQNLSAIRQLLPKSKKNLIKEYPALNHLFQHCDTGLPTEYSSIEETISPEVLDDMVKWIKQCFGI